MVTKDKSKHRFSTWALLGVIVLVSIVSLASSLDGTGSKDRMTKFLSGGRVVNSNLIDDLNYSINLSSIAVCNCSDPYITSSRYNVSVSVPLIVENEQVVTTASNFNNWGCYRNATYCDGLIGSTARTIATAYTIDVLRCFPYVTGKGYSIDQLGVRVGVANTTNTQGLKIALYSDNGFAYPSTLITNTSTITLSGTGFTVQTITPYRLQNNTLYWMCSNVNTTTTSIRVNVVAIADYPSILGLSGTTAMNIGYTTAHLFNNSFPSTYPSGATYVTAIYPNVYARVRTDI